MQVYQKLLFIFGTNFVKTATQLNQGIPRESFYTTRFLSNATQRFP